VQAEWSYSAARAVSYEFWQEDLEGKVQYPEGRAKNHRK
jgi:hypothetical protein